MRTCTAPAARGLSRGSRSLGGKPRPRPKPRHVETSPKCWGQTSRALMSSLVWGEPGASSSPAAAAGAHRARALYDRFVPSKWKVLLGQG